MKRFSLGLLLLSLFLVSCSKVVYLDNMASDKAYTALTPELSIRKGDRLFIVVKSKNPELAAPYNINTGVSYQVAGDGEVLTKHNSSASLLENAYEVDETGMIDFPVLGQITVAGLTSKELSDLIENRLISDQYIEDPIVDVTLSGLKVTVMGEVVKNGVLTLNSNGMNLLEALSQSGGITQNAAPNKVCVIRKEGDDLKKYVTDIRSTALFESPCFALQQDDIIYVQPRSARATVQEDRGWRLYSVTTGLVSLVISLLVLLK